MERSSFQQTCGLSVFGILADGATGVAECVSIPTGWPLGSVSHCMRKNARAVPGCTRVEDDLASLRYLRIHYSNIFSGEIDLDNSALIWPGSNMYETIVLFDDSVNGCESKTRSFPGLLGCEEGFECT